MLVCLFGYGLIYIFYNPEDQQYFTSQVVIWNFNFWQGVEHWVFATLYCNVALDAENRLQL